jgi:hypothetical protein
MWTLPLSGEHQDENMSDAPFITAIMFTVRHGSDFAN